MEGLSGSARGSEALAGIESDLALATHRHACTGSAMFFTSCAPGGTDGVEFLVLLMAAGKLRADQVPGQPVLLASYDIPTAESEPKKVPTSG